MAKEEKKLQPIIIKRIKKGGHAGHHGGAWKIAYADFVTAMMAFFLLMWLLGSTTKGELQGIADYFRTPLKVAMQGGSGSGDSSALVKGGGTDLTRSFGKQSRTDKPDVKRTINLQAAQQKQDFTKLMELKRKMEGAFADKASLQPYIHQIHLDVTGDGLRIQIVDAKNRPMFDTGSARLKDYTREILHETARVLNEVDNRITLAGHTDAQPYSGGERGYSNWELSADRANASRRQLIASGVTEKKILRVVGLADSVPLAGVDPLDASNRRISVIVMTKTAAESAVGDGPTLDIKRAPRGPAQAVSAPASSPPASAPPAG